MHRYFLSFSIKYLGGGGVGEGFACVVRWMLHTTGFFQRQSREGMVEGSKGKFHLSTTTSPVSVRYCHKAHSRKTPREILPAGHGILGIPRT